MQTGEVPSHTAGTNTLSTAVNGGSKLGGLSTERYLPLGVNDQQVKTHKPKTPEKRNPRQSKVMVLLLVRKHSLGSRQGRGGRINEDYSGDKLGTASISGRTKFESDLLRMCGHVTCVWRESVIWDGPGMVLPTGEKLFLPAGPIYPL